MSEFGQIIASWAHTTVEQADPRALVSLEFFASLDPRAVFVRGDRLFLGNDKDGNEVIYRVTGWHADDRALIVERVYE